MSLNVEMSFIRVVMEWLFIINQIIIIMRLVIMVILIGVSVMSRLGEKQDVLVSKEGYASGKNRINEKDLKTLGYRQVKYVNSFSYHDEEESKEVNNQQHVLKQQYRPAESEVEVTPSSSVYYDPTNRIYGDSAICSSIRNPGFCVKQNCGWCSSKNKCVQESVSLDPDVCGNREIGLVPLSSSPPSFITRHDPAEPDNDQSQMTMFIIYMQRTSHQPLFRRSITRDGIEHDFIRLSHQSSLKDKHHPDLDSLQHMVKSLSEQIRERDILIVDLQNKHQQSKRQAFQDKQQNIMSTNHLNNGLKTFHKRNSHDFNAGGEESQALLIKLFQQQLKDKQDEIDQQQQEHENQIESQKDYIRKKDEETDQMWYHWSLENQTLIEEKKELMSQVELYEKEQFERGQDYLHQECESRYESLLEQERNVTERLAEVETQQRSDFQRYHEKLQDIISQFENDQVEDQEKIEQKYLRDIQAMEVLLNETQSSLQKALKAHKQTQEESNFKITQEKITTAEIRKQADKQINDLRKKEEKIADLKKQIDQQDQELIKKSEKTKLKEVELKRKQYKISNLTTKNKQFQEDNRCFQQQTSEQQEIILSLEEEIKEKKQRLTMLECNIDVSSVLEKSAQQVHDIRRITEQDQETDEEQEENRSEIGNESQNKSESEHTDIILDYNEMRRSFGNQYSIPSTNGFGRQQSGIQEHFGDEANQSCSSEMDLQMSLGQQLHDHLDSQKEGQEAALQIQLTQCQESLNFQLQTVQKLNALIEDIQKDHQSEVKCLLGSYEKSLQQKEEQISLYAIQINTISSDSKYYIEELVTAKTKLTELLYDYDVVKFNYSKLRRASSTRQL